MQFKDILVTGAAGFLGAHVVRSLLKRGSTITATKRAETDTWRLDEVAHRIRIAEMDLLDAKSIKEVIADIRPQVVVHCAAYGVDYRQQDPDLAIAVNVTGSWRLLEACAENGVRRFIHIGSCFEYGDKDHPIGEDEALQPTAIYGATKATASLVLHTCAEKLGIDMVVLRPFGMWGPLEGKHRLVPQIVNACQKQTPIDLTGCEQVRDYTFVADMADMVVAIALHEDFPTGQTVNLGSGKPVVLRDLVLEIARELGCERLMRFGRLPYRPTEMWHVVADNGKQRRLLPDLKQTLIAEGLRIMLAQSGGLE
jgi:nucleoside-diphosphate-sugar epimerase